MKAISSSAASCLKPRLQAGLVRILFYILVVLFALSPALVRAADSYIKQWDGAVFTGSISSTSYQYYLEPQIRFIDDTYVFNEFLLLTGLGYRVNPSFVFYVGPGLIITKLTDGRLYHELRGWQQLNWTIRSGPSFALHSRTRFEERHNTQYSEMAYRFRQRLWLRIPFRFNPSFSLSTFDEIFLNFNHPQWVSPNFFSQNRAFIGIGCQYSKNMTIDVGYMNQFLNSAITQFDHVLLVTFNISN